MNIIVLHVLAGMCGFSDDQYKARIGKFSTDLTAGRPVRIRMAGKPENFASTGFFHSCRTPHDSNALSWVARKETSLARITAHCTALAYLTGGDVPAASRDRKSRKRCYGRKPGGEFGQLRIGSDDYGSVQGQHLNR